MGQLLFAILSILASVPAHASDCRQIEEVYSSCGVGSFTAFADRFEFLLGRERVPVPCDDGLGLSFYDRMEKMDVASILSIPYSPGPIPLPETRRNRDPGRLRLEPLLKSVYGRNEGEVRANLVNVSFLHQTLRFQKKLGAAAALERVGRELLAEAERDPALRKFLEPFTSGKENLREGTFFWRTVAGSHRLSTHAFGTGIDLLTAYPRQYWLWDEKAKNPGKAAQGEAAYRNDHFIAGGAPYFHPKAVEIFEKNGFIWGGKWNHYDTMHFEYRPEFFGTRVVDCRDSVTPFPLEAELPGFHLNGAGFKDLSHDH